MTAPGGGAPERFGDYRLEGTLGAGGMGTVFRARDPDGRLVALKLLANRGGRTQRMRFRYEIACLRRLDHPNVVRVLDASAEGPRPWVAMEYVDAPNLHELTRRVLRKTGRGLALPEALGYFEGLANALGALREAGILHRDVKPANVLVRPRGGAVLVDFGLAQSQEGGADITRSGEMVGTLDFIAPEQLQGRPASFASDLYSAGLSLWYCLAGELPFSEHPAMLRASMRFERDVPSIREFRPDVGEGVDRVLQLSLQRVPERRLGSPGELALALRALADRVLWEQAPGTGS